MLKHVLVPASLAAFCLAAGPAARADESAVELGLRSGFTFPLGDLAGATATSAASAYSDAYTGFIPFIADVGFKPNGNLYFGAFFQYAIGLTKNCSGCSGNQIRFGIDAQYHLLPREAMDPWLGIGTAYDITGESQGTQSGSFKGFEFMHVMGGLDFELSPGVKMGPFLMFALGQYSTATLTTPGGSVSADIPNTSLHELFMLGIRGTYDIRI